MRQGLPPKDLMPAKFQEPFMKPFFRRNAMRFIGGGVAAALVWAGSALFSGGAAKAEHQAVGDADRLANMPLVLNEKNPPPPVPVSVPAPSLEPTH
jgi:hypothetical protein